MAVDSARTSLERALAALDLGRVYVQTVKYASFRARSSDLGRELAQKVLAAAIDPGGSSWDPEREPDLFRHLVGRVNGALALERKKLRLRADPQVVAELTERLYSPAATPLALLEERENRERDGRRWQTLRDSFAGPGDELARKILDQYETGTEGAADQARALGADIAEIYLERRRIARRARATRAGEDAHREAGALELAGADDEVAT